MRDVMIANVPCGFRRSKKALGETYRAIGVRYEDVNRLVQRNLMHRPRRILVAYTRDDEDDVEAFAGKLCAQSLHGLRVVDVDELGTDMAVGSSSRGREPFAA